MVWAIVIARNLTMGVAWHRFPRSSTSTSNGPDRPVVTALGGAAADDVPGRGRWTWRRPTRRSTRSAPARSRTSPGRAGWTSPRAPSAAAASRSARRGTRRSRCRPKLVILALRDHAFAKAPYSGRRWRDGHGRRREGHRPIAASRTLDPLAMLEAERPLIGGPSTDPAVRWVGSSIRRCCGTARRAGRVWSSARSTSSTSITSWTCAATR